MYILQDKAGGGKNNEDITGYGSDSSDLSLSLEKIVVGNGNLHVDQDEDGDEFDELEEGNRQILDEEKKKKCDEEVPSFNGPQKIKVVPLKKDGGRIPPTQKISNAEKLMKNVVEAAQKQRAEQKQQQKSVKPMEIGVILMFDRVEKFKFLQGKLQKSGNKVVEFEGYESDGVYPDNEDIEDDVYHPSYHLCTQ
jgi:hypothetical protein